MGFGLLFIGYFITFFMSVHSYGFAFELIGYTVMLYAVSKLAEYKHRLFRVIYPLLGMALYSVYMGLSKMNDVLELQLPIFNTTALVILSLFAAVCTVLFHVFLLLPIRSIAKDVAENGLALGAVFALTFSCIGCLVEPIVGLVGQALRLLAENSSAVGADTAIGIIGGADGPTEILVSTSTMPVWSLISLFLQLLCPLVTLIFLFLCYARICAPEDVDMPQKPSRFAFVNRFREKQAQRQAETEKARQEYQQKLEEKYQSKKKKHKKKRK